MAPKGLIENETETRCIQKLPPHLALRI